MKRTTKPVAASFNFPALKGVTKMKERTVAPVNDFLDGEDHQDLERIGHIQRIRSVRAKRAMLDS